MITSSKLAAWLRQPTTIAGIGGLVAVAAGAIAHALTHDTSWAVAAAGIAGSAAAIVLPDNSAARSSVETLVIDAVNAAVQRRLATSVPVLAADALAAIQALTTPSTPAVAVTVATTPAAAPGAPA